MVTGPWTPAPDTACFICGVIHRADPELTVNAAKVLGAAGQGSDASIRVELEQNSEKVINLSFGGYTQDDREPPDLGPLIQGLTSQGTVVVAAAGNNADGGTEQPASPIRGQRWPGPGLGRVVRNVVAAPQMAAAVATTSRTGLEPHLAAARPLGSGQGSLADSPWSGNNGRSGQAPAAWELDQLTAQPPKHTKLLAAA